MQKSIPWMGYIIPNRAPELPVMQTESHSSPENQVQTLPRLAIILTHVAITGWVVSLALPGFVVDSNIHRWLGGEILISGLLFGWFGTGWAAYANPFFAYVAVQLYRGKPVRVSVILMLVLASAIFIFGGVPRDEGSMALDPVVSWGWGAVVWGCSIVLLGCAVLVQRGAIRRNGVIAASILLTFALATVGYTHHIQWERANLQEREIYLSGGLAFANTRFCGVPFSWAEVAVIPPGEPIAMDVEQSLQSGVDRYLLLPTLPNIQEGDFGWHTRAGGVKVRISSPARYSLQARRTADGAVIRLLEIKTQKVLYEQPLKLIPLARSDQVGMRYCPFTSATGWTTLKMGYDQALLRAIGPQDVAPVAAASLGPEAAYTRCDLTIERISDNDMRGNWDGREVKIPDHSLASTQGFCSDSYIGLVNVQTLPESDFLGPVVILYKRSTLDQLAVFSGGRPCPDAVHGCKKMPNSSIKGFRIEADSVVVDTERGDLRAKRIVQ